MAPPTIHGDPKISQDEGSGSVLLDVVVAGAEPAKTKWFLGEDELAASNTYKFSHADEPQNRKKLRCEIKVRFFARLHSLNLLNLLLSLFADCLLSFSSLCAYYCIPLLFRTLTRPWPASTRRCSTRRTGPRTTPRSRCSRAVSCTPRPTQPHPPPPDAPEFSDKPKIVQRDGGNVIVIKVRGKSHIECKAEWFKVSAGGPVRRLPQDDKPLTSTDRVKVVQKPDDKDKDAVQYLLEITGPQKSDEAKYKCVLKNAEGSNQQSLNLVFD